MKFSAMSVFKDLGNFNSRYGQIFELVKLLRLVQNRNFSSTRQLSEIITLEPLGALGCVNNLSRTELEPISYDIDIKGFLRLLLNWSQKLRILRMLNSL
jgi:hypothetical protein